MRLQPLDFLPILLGLATLCFAQEQTLEPEGGSFDWRGRTIEVSAEELGRHLDIVTRLNPRADRATRLEMAWARAIRLAGAEAEKLVVDEAAFNVWMRDRHAALMLGLRENELSGEEIVQAWRAHVRALGFDDTRSYEAACREEFLGEQFVAIEYPVAELDEVALRRRFREIHTAYALRALVFAPETLDELQPMDQDDEEHRAIFRSWWQSLSDFEKRVIDDRERPASEVECLYVRLDDKSIAELKEFFERKRPGTGTSLAEGSAHYAMNDLDRLKMGMRWVEYRRTTLAHINGELPPGLDDAESFELVADHLEREWRIIRYLGDIWKELRALPVPADVHGAALRHGFEYRHFDLQPNYRLQEDADGGGVLVGDHPLGFRRTTPGEIFDYNTRSDSANKVYYVEGVVDQPGLHASIWRLIRFEGQRVLDAETAIPLAWDRFAAANTYRLALERANAFAAALEDRVRAAVVEAKPTDEAARARLELDFARDAFADYFDERKALAKESRVIGPFVARPFEEIEGIEKTRGILEQRVLDFVTREWPRLVGPLGTSVEKGQIIPMGRSDSRRLALLLRVEEIHPPTNAQYDRDPAGRRRARQSLETDGRRTRAAAAQTVYRYPAIVHHFKLKAPQLDREMSERLRDK